MACEAYIIGFRAYMIGCGVVASQPAVRRDSRTAGAACARVRMRTGV